MNMASSWIGIIGLILYLVLVSGVWVGLAGLWRGSRGASWWLMGTGMLFNTLGPILWIVGTWLVFAQMTRSLGSSPSSPPPSGGNSTLVAVIAGAGGLLTPLGMLLFSVGFSLHGFKVARARERIGELEQLTEAMGEEITRLKEGQALP
ncbi:hypothetical protein [Luteolibacter sp. Populi]|uniref:hypothetical protein n=1 Tax=Luteolibacter sp. Populi TaxID=3230487 RepID=UPI003467AF00